MAATVIVNRLTVVHAASGGQAISGPPDVCMTPLLSGPAPIPYVNLAFSRDLVDGAATVRADGHPIATTASAFSPSYGDEPGTLGGVMSGVNRGKAKFYTFSPDVIAEGKPVCRLSDAMSMNGNAPNTHTPAEIQANIAPVGGKGTVWCNAFCFCNKKGSNGEWRDGKDFINPVDPSFT
jgi:hypothetical protein